MDLYLNNKIKKKLKDIQAIRANYGNLADTIAIRINTLKVANNLSEISVVKPERLHQLQGEYKEMYGIDISKNYRLIIKPSNNQMPYEKEKIFEIEIIDIIDYH